MEMNISKDNRIDKFTRELAVALRRITGRQDENTPVNLAKPMPNEKTKK